MWFFSRGGDTNVNDALDGEVLLPKGWKVPPGNPGVPKRDLKR